MFVVVIITRVPTIVTNVNDITAFIISIIIVNIIIIILL